MTIRVYYNDGNQKMFTVRTMTDFFMYILEDPGGNPNAIMKLEIVDEEKEKARDALMRAANATNKMT